MDENVRIITISNEDPSGAGWINDNIGWIRKFRIATNAARETIKSIASDR
jgi:hypothetical protein